MAMAALLAALAGLLCRSRRVRAAGDHAAASYLGARASNKAMPTIWLIVCFLSMPVPFMGQ